MEVRGSGLNGEHRSGFRAKRPRDLSDEELGRALVERRTPAVEAEVYNRFTPLAEAHARLFCQQLFHRGAVCRGHAAGDGACNGLYETAFAEIMRKIIGSDGRRPLRSLLSTWATDQRSGRSFGAFLKVALHPDDVLRASCADRQLPTRGDRPPAGLVADALEAYRSLWQAVRPDPGLDRLHPDVPGVVKRWLDGLWRDAVQPGDGELFDASRLARWMICADPTPDQLEQVRDLARGLDDHLAAAWPEWYDRHLDRGRQQTNPLVAMDALTSAECPGAA